ncbi:MAG: hypothetical protein EHM17_00315 [Verrucomicrobiaceae bacterium]|nr:MAG: hypothetical protein EHM17_17240 [Verrucomicrobiaceae bacterium]RPJ30583.1 MAG: hypothetical protein EHM17_16525 [Verrucomicrobiaceae bacterium]RPJ36020.1 MAG: hypothetical protein EHM17_00315 [Verrucomicrobiaceae bacterium]
MTEAQLQKLTTQTPITKTRVVETGEGGYEVYDYYDPASQAKQLLAQPAQVSTDYIRNNFPSLAQLPQSVLNQMGQDWRTAYAHIHKISEQSSSGWWGGAGGKEGFVPVPIINRGTGQPELQVGGNGEMFAEALPYVTYSPEYGLGVPKAGMRPYDSGFSFLDFVGAAAPGIALSAILGPAGFGLSLPAAGAVSGGFNALLNDGNVLKGALTGGALGGLGQMATPAISSAVGATGLTGAAADAVKAGALAAGKAAITGGDPLQAALVAATGAGVGSTVASADALKDLDPTVAKALTAAASGAARAAVGGGDPVTAALTSAINVGTKAITGATPGATASAPAPTTSTQDILSQLGAQETEAQQLQQILADAGIAPEQRGLLAGDYKQEGVGDVLARGAESALGALVPSAQASGQDRVVLPQPTEAGGAQPSDYKYFFDVMSKGDPQAAYAGLSADEKAAVDRAGQEFQASSEIRKGDLLSAYKSGELTPTETPTESWIDRGMLGAESPASMPDILEMLEQQQARQQSMQKAVSEYSKPENVQPDILNVLNRQQADAEAAIAALEQATGQKITAGDADILARLAEQGASQREMEAALRGEIGGLGTTFDQRLADILAQQGTGQAEMEAALRGEFQRQFEAARAAGATSEAALQGAIAGVGQQAAAAKQAADQTAAGQADITAKITATDQKLADFAVQTGQSFDAVKAQFKAEFDAAQAAGKSSDAALQAGIDKVGQTAAANQKATDTQLGQLGVDVNAVKTGLGQLGTSTTQQFGDVNARITELQRQGLTQSEATNKALLELSSGQATLGQQQAAQAAAAKEAAAQAAANQQATQTQFGDVNARIVALMRQGADYQTATTQAQTELKQGQAQLGTKVGELGTKVGDLGTTLGGQIAGLGTQLTAAKQQAAQAQQQANMGTLFGLLGGFGGQQAAPQAAAPVTPANIGYVYDIGGKSIFANPQQEKAFVSPYAEGGTVEDLMKILRG